MIGLIIWASVIDNLLRELVPGVGRFTPVGASDSLTAGFADYLIAPVAGGLLLIAYVVTFVAVGALVVARRDVT